MRIFFIFKYPGVRGAVKNFLRTVLITFKSTIRNSSTIRIFARAPRPLSDAVTTLIHDPF